MTTIRKQLDKLDFDWDCGKIVLHEVKGNYTHAPGWSCGPFERKRISLDDPILDQEFDNGYGAPNCPRFVARDMDAVYFPVQHDGATWVEKVYVDIDEYLEEDSVTPYPGG